MNHLSKFAVKLQVVLVMAGALAVLPGCGQRPPKKGLVKDLETLMPGQPQVPPAAAEAPEDASILYADDLVSITRFSLEPGKEIPEHPADRRVLYFLGSGTVEITHGGASHTVSATAGQVEYLEPGDYSVANSGEDALQFLIVDRTDVDLPADMAALTGGGVPPGDVVFSNADVRVWTLTIKPTDEAELPQVPIRIVYSESALVLAYTGAGGQTEEVDMAAGQAVGRAGNDVSVQDIGQGGGQIVVFEWLA